METTDVENGLVDTMGEGESGTNGENSITINTLSGVRCIAGEKLLRSTGSPVWCSVMIWRDGIGEGREAKEAGCGCIIAADLHCCMAEMNTAL